ncbi:hypothetical protein [Capnocytophaga gingivalis]|uniref:Uncharacterized protein n=1 Tax=Capnocytophaga gingivalis TaxID=1017 RepID=A0ABU5ZAK5_9FLAO|nr:hypothetical protein [Capnocytophaga gingivalis]MEB3074772.1 hypothetical protein [Capnocytophaga gingivalis]
MEILGYELQVRTSGEALGDDVKIVFYDKKGQVTLINPDKANDWKDPSKKYRKNTCQL